jgi:hypothetical protein
MSSRFSIVQTLLILGICACLALFLGYIVATPLTWTAIFSYGAVFTIFALPFLLRWHFPLMILAWNMNAVVFLLPGRPPLWLFMVLMSLLFSLAQYSLNKRYKFLSVPAIMYPLLFIAALVLLTAKLRGGFGLGAFGSASSGGKRYFFILGSILGYFAFAWRGIPRKHAYAYASAFFLGGASSIIGNLLPLVNPAFYIIFAIFPPEQSGLEALGLMEQAASSFSRFSGVALAATAIFCTLLACYGIRGILDLSAPLRFLPFQWRTRFSVTKPWRLIIFFGAIVISLWGGYRSTVIIFGMTFFFQFYYEKLFRSGLFPFLFILGILLAASILPMANKLPLPMQRALSILPLNLDPVAQNSAQTSSDWRIAIWKRVLPDVPKYLFLGKGYSISSHELEVLRGSTENIDMTIAAGDYHSGVLTTIIPLGIFGLIGFLWFAIASIKVLLKNYHFGDPSLLNLNRFLLAFFIARLIYFFVVFGSLYSDLAFFTGIIGLSVSLNHGVRTRDSIKNTLVSEQITTT